MCMRARLVRSAAEEEEGATARATASAVGAAPGEEGSRATFLVDYVCCSSLSSWTKSAKNPVSRRANMELLS